MYLIHRATGIDHKRRTHDEHGIGILQVLLGQGDLANIFRGQRYLSKPPIDDIETYWSPAEKLQAMGMLARSVIGSPDTVRLGLDALVAETGANEVMVVSDVYDHSMRLRSFEMIADTMRLET